MAKEKGTEGREDLKVNNSEYGEWRSVVYNVKWIGIGKLEGLKSLTLSD